MPATSDKQRKLMAIAEHEPSKVQKKNQGVLKMSHGQLHDFAATKGLKSSKKTETREGRSLVDMEVIKREPETDDLKLSGFYYKPGETGHDAQENHEFLASWKSREIKNGPDYKAEVFFYGPDTDYRAEEINPQHYGRDYEPFPLKEMLKGGEKVREAGVRLVWDDCYYECDTPGSVTGADESSLAYGTTSYKSIKTDFPDSRTHQDQISFGRTHEEIDEALHDDDDSKERGMHRNAHRDIHRP